MKLMASQNDVTEAIPLCFQIGMREEMSLGRQEAFEIFKRDHADSVTIEDNKQVLKQR